MTMMRLAAISSGTIPLVSLCPNNLDRKRTRAESNVKLCRSSPSNLVADLGATQFFVISGLGSVCRFNLLETLVFLTSRTWTDLQSSTMRWNMHGYTDVNVSLS
jgi:hypothetical protein